MLTSKFAQTRHQSRGIVLIMALIVLVAMTLGAVALVRSVYTSNVIAGNLAFQQSATHSADAGVEAAIVWLENNNGQLASSTATACTPNTLPVLACNQTAYGYLAIRQDPTGSESWSKFWTNQLAANAKTLTADNAGNTVSYVIQRMCSLPGDAQSTGNECATSPRASAGTCAGGSSCDSQKDNLAGVSQVYYRITVKVVGPRNTESFTQTIVAL
ncbi:pilus assembly PilX family protein [Aquabacterium sp.]|uniref:pilus assembly PilX family protein n=1 Tax=Aquabacterium sp. TaxID=1872578 RepID=UPI003BB06532